MTALRRVLVIGLDGASPDLVRRWTESGDLPALRRLIDRGVFGTLRSTVPPVSPVAWSTFMTGRNPAGHGVLGFRNLDARRYEFREPDIISSEWIAGRTFWDFAGEHGAKVGALWVPVTYPQWPVNGILVSGYPTPSAVRSFGHPESLVAALPGLTEDSAFFNSAPPEKIAAELERLARERGRVAADLMRREAFDVFVVVIGSIDRAQHDFWRHLDHRSPAHNPGEARRFWPVIRDTYIAADRAVSELIEAASSDTAVVVMSDHGGGPAAEREVHVNAWLRKQRLLAAHPPGRGRGSWSAAYRWLKDRVAAREKIFRYMPHGLRRRLTALDAAATLGLGSIDWAQTLAFRFPLYPPFEGIAINLAGRQPQGCVAPDDYETIRDDVLSALRATCDPSDDRPILAGAFRREEVYSGHHLERFPDIVIEFREGYKGGTDLWGDWVRPVRTGELRKLSGAHRMEGTLIAAGPGFRRGIEVEGASLTDIAPTVLYAMGLPQPAAMDGRVLRGLFEPDHIAKHPIETIDASSESARPSSAGLSPIEQAEIAEHLRGLGYMD